MALQGVPVAGSTQRFTGMLADGRLVGTPQRNAQPVLQQIGYTANGLGVAFGHHDHGHHIGDGEGLFDQPLGARDRQVGIVRGQVEISRARYLELAQERIRSAVLHIHMHAALAREVCPDLLNR